MTSPPEGTVYGLKEAFRLIIIKARCHDRSLEPGPQMDNNGLVKVLALTVRTADAAGALTSTRWAGKKGKDPHFKVVMS